MKKFDVSREVAVLPLSLYTLGFTIGPSIAAPLSEIYGRRNVYWATLPLLLIFTAIAGSATNMPVLIVFRLLSGLGGSGALAIGAGMFICIPNPYSHTFLTCHRNYRRSLVAPPERPRFHFLYFSTVSRSILGPSYRRIYHCRI